jgi:hypothetical protein
LRYFENVKVRDEVYKFSNLAYLIEKTGWTYYEIMEQPDWFVGNLLSYYSSKLIVENKKNGR